jgi:hypothetical protein
MRKQGSFLLNRPMGKGGGGGGLRILRHKSWHVWVREMNGCTVCWAGTRGVHFRPHYVARLQNDDNKKRVKEDEAKFAAEQAAKVGCFSTLIVVVAVTQCSEL